MTLTTREKELAAVGISIAAGCRPCTDYHVKAARAARVEDADIQGAIAAAVAVRTAATAAMEAHGFAHLGPVAAAAAPDDGRRADTRVGALVAVGAALAVSCTGGLAEHLATARSLGVSADEVDAVADLVGFIKERAASHVDRLVAAYVPAAAAARPEAAAAACGCG